MADNIVAGLFGLNPQMYGEQQRVNALQEGISLAQPATGLWLGYPWPSHCA
jgi:hypothetical protein